MSQFNCREDVIDYLETESEGMHDREDLESLDNKELFATLLNWEGIIGFEDFILSACKALHLPEQDRGLLHPQVDLKGKLVLQMYSGGKWSNIAWAENTPEGLEWLESKYDDYDNPSMRVELFT